MHEHKHHILLSANEASQYLPLSAVENYVLSSAADHFNPIDKMLNLHLLRVQIIGPLHYPNLDL